MVLFRSADGETDVLSLQTFFPGQVFDQNAVFIKKFLCQFGGRYGRMSIFSLCNPAQYIVCLTGIANQTGDV
jgi:hypothetical protein